MTNEGAEFCSVGHCFEPLEYYPVNGERKRRCRGGHEHDEIEAGFVRRQNGHDGNGHKLAKPVVEKPMKGPAAESFPFSDLGNAERLIARHGTDLHYCRQLGWLVWRNGRWQPDETGEVMKRAKKTVRAITLENSNEWDKLMRHALSSESAKRLAAMMTLAESEDGVPVTLEELDADPLLLNVKNGAIDLRTGALREHRREDLCTRIVPVAFDPKATCPKWEEFLSQVTGDDPELVAFLQRAVGYSLTGDVSEQVLLFLHGMGSNGKSTFLAVMMDLLGDYAGQAAPGLILEHRGDRHPTELADLRGKRLIVSVEVGEGKRMAEELVKQLTGGDRIKARLMRMDFFEFAPQFKLWLAANHKPVIRGTDHAIWRRIPLVPFEVKFTDDAEDARFRKDRGLLKKLRRELPGILAWAVRGCLQWRQDGLNAPEAVQNATKAYREEMDPLTDFFADCCVLQSWAQVENPRLWAAYEAWCQENGERNRLGRKQFASELNARHFEQERGHKARIWRGIGLRDVDRDGERDTS